MDWHDFHALAVTVELIVISTFWYHQLSILELCESYSLGDIDPPDVLDGLGDRQPRLSVAW